MFPKETRANEIKNEIHETKKWEDKIKWEDLKYRTKIFTYDFYQYETITYFGDDIYTGKINVDEAKMNQSNLLKDLIELINKPNLTRKKGKIKKKRYLWRCICSIWRSRINT